MYSAGRAQSQYMQTGFAPVASAIQAPPFGPMLLIGADSCIGAAGKTLRPPVATLRDEITN
jgi:hypothetical protein